jgi:hypothetical protein
MVTGSVKGVTNLDTELFAWAADTGYHHGKSLLKRLPRGPALTLAPHIIPAYKKGMVDLLLFTIGRDKRVPLNKHLLEIMDWTARQEIPFDLVVRTVRTEQERCARALFNRMEQVRTADRSRTLFHFAQKVSLFFDLNIDALASRYLEENRRTEVRRQADKSAMVEVMRCGGQVTPEAARSTLGIDISDHHLPVVLWLDGGLSLTQAAAVERGAARRAAEYLGCPTPLMVPDARALFVWVSRRRPFGHCDLSVFDEVTHRTPGLRVSVGLANPGLEGFRRGLVTARDTYEVARLGGSSKPVTTYRDVGLMSLLAQDPERAKWFAAELLGPLWSADPCLAELRGTLLRYLENDASLARTAAELYIHRNTVAHRLNRIRELLGRSTVLRTVEMHAALLLAAVLMP